MSQHSKDHSLIDKRFSEITPEQYSGDLPEKFTYPFWYEPHPVSVYASDQLRDQIAKATHWTQDFGIDPENPNKPMSPDAPVGKMFGVLVVRSAEGKLGFLKAYSGTMAGVVEEDGFVPMVYDRFDAEGFFKKGEAQLIAINTEVEALENHPERESRKAHLEEVKKRTTEELTAARKQQKAQKEERRVQRLDMLTALDPEEYQAFDKKMIQASAADQRAVKALQTKGKEEVAEAQKSVDEIEGRLEHLKNLRKEKSANLQNQLFDQYQFLNILGETQSPLPIFKKTPLQRPPAGAGDCAAPKLLQYAFVHGYQPIAMAEFWWGKTPSLEVRKHNFYYPACRGKCEPILGHMLKGMEVEDNPLEQIPEDAPTVEIVYEDDYMVVVNKPHEMLSVPGRRIEHSVYTEMKKRYPKSTGPLLVHRLDMATSGILLVAKNKDSHQKIQAQFIDRTIKKRYTALLEGEVVKPKGKINLPLIVDYLNRPMQKVDFDEGKPALTFYEVVEVANGRTRIYFYPVTGRTHQLRVHAAHELGLNIPIVGDDIYGQRDVRLHLHAGFIEMTHPETGKRMTFTAEAPF